MLKIFAISLFRTIGSKHSYIKLYFPDVYSNFYVYPLHFISEHVYCTETRPYNQGARLTAYELVQEKIPATLIVDSMVAALMTSRIITAVVVGADRVYSYFYHNLIILSIKHNFIFKQ